MYPKIRDSVMLYRSRSGTLVAVSLSEFWNKEYTVDSYVFDLVSKLDGKRPISEVIQEVAVEWGQSSKTVGNLVEILKDEALLDENPVPVAKDRYHRQRLFWHEAGYGMKSNGDEMHRRLRKGVIAIVGVGGAGGYLLQSLSAAGVGTILIIDNDIVNVSNLNRQILFKKEDEGLPKVEVLCRRVKAINPDVEVRPIKLFIREPEELTAVIGGCDVVVNCADKPSVAIMSDLVSEACLPLGISHVVGSGYGASLGAPGYSVLPGRTPCWRCAEKSARVESGRGDDVPVKGSTQIGGSFAPVTGFVANMTAWDVARILVGLPPILAGALRELDVRTLEWYETPVVASPGCFYCSGLAT